MTEERAHYYAERLAFNLRITIGGLLRANSVRFRRIRPVAGRSSESAF